MHNGKALDFSFLLDGKGDGIAVDWKTILTQEGFNNKLSEQMNKAIYTLSIQDEILPLFSPFQ